VAKATRKAYFSPEMPILIRFAVLQLPH